MTWFFVSPSVRCISRGHTTERVLLRESLSSQNSAFAKLIRSGQPDLAANDIDLASTEVTVSKSRPYRMHRKLNPGEQAELVRLYEAGESMVELSEKFECHRQTVARQLKKAGVALREQRVRTSAFDQRAKVLYEQGHSLDEVADLLGVQASTINRAVKGAGGQLRLPGHQPRGR
jgi:DNA-directed RNA polymerase specialized sigma24 family protein